MVIILDTVLAEEFAVPLALLKGEGDRLVLVRPANEGVVFCEAGNGQDKPATMGSFDDMFVDFLRRSQPVGMAPQPVSFLLVFRDVGAVLCGTLSGIRSQAGTYPARVSVLLVGPLTEAVDTAALLKPHPSVPSRRLMDLCWFVGSETAGGGTVTAETRLDTAQHLLLLLAAGGEALAEVLGLFGQRETPGNGPAGAHAFAAFGFRSWAPAPAAVQQFAAAAVNGLFAAQVQEHRQSAAQDAERWEGLARSLLGRIRALSVPHGSGDQAGTARRFSDGLPKPPAKTPFDAWPVTLSHEEALESGTRKIEPHFHAVVQYRDQLVQSLQTLAADVRRHGHEVFRGEKAQWRERVGECHDLAELGMMLQHFFPHFRQDRQDAELPGACQPATAPSAAECHVVFVDRVQKILKSGSARLPTRKCWRYVLAGVTGALLLSAALVWLGLDAWQAALPSFLALGSAAVLALWARRRFLTMKHELESHYRKEYRSLRQQFIAKVEWVTEKAGRTVEAQVYSDLSAVGNQIERQLARLVPQWQHAMAAAARAGTDGGEGVTWPESSSSEKLAEILATSQREIIRNALSLARLGDLGPRVRSLWLTLKNAAARELVTGRMWPYDLVGHEILACTDVREPHFLANRGDNFIAEGALVRKTFVLPRDYPANAEGDVRSKMKSSPMEAAVWSGRLTAPAVLVSRRFLAESEFRACLRRTRAEP